METSVRSRARSLLPGRRNRPGREEAIIEGSARLGRRTKVLVKHLGPGDIAIIDHADLDRIAAEDLVATGVPAIVNVAPFSTGQYPNAGPLTLAEAGVRLIEAPEAPLFDELRDGQAIAISGGEIRSNGTLLASGRVLATADLAEQLEQQRRRIDAALGDFAENTLAHLREEGELLVGGIEVPHLRTKFRDRQVLIVVRGSTYRKDLRALAAYIRGVRPLLVAGWKPDVVLGDMDSASDEALRSGAELIVHSYPDGRAPGADRLERMGLNHKVVRSVGTSQDVAMLLAHEMGADLIVSVGAHFNLVEFLERSRAGMSSTFLTRLRVGELLVDAKGVSRLYNPGVTGQQLAFFLAASMVLLTIVIVNTPALSDLVDLIWLKLKIILGI